MHADKATLIIAPLLLAGCASGLFAPTSGLNPAFDAAATSTVITQIHRSGTVAPTYNHVDTLLIAGDGTWRAARVFPYTATPSTHVLATGSLSPAQLTALVNQAFASPRFVDLPATSDDRSIGGGTQTLTLNVLNGSHSVSVTGSQPPAFSSFDRAIASATVDMDRLGPAEAGQ